MIKELILAVTDHRKFGQIFTCHIITPASGITFYTSIERANNINVLEADNKSAKAIEIVKLIQEYDDAYIANLFTKKKEDAREFIKKVDQEFIQTRIRPHIERRIFKIMHLLSKANLRIFYKDRNYAKIYLSDEIQLIGYGAKAVFNFNRTPECTQYFLSIEYNNTTIRLKNKKAIILTDSPCNLILDQKLYFFPDIDSKKLAPFFEKDHISIAKQTEKTYFEKFIFNAVKSFKVNANGFNIIENTNLPKPLLYLQNDLEGKTTLLMKFQFGNQIVFPNNPEKNFLTLDTADNEYTFYKTERNPSGEKQFGDYLTNLGLQTTDNIHFYPEITSSNQENSLYTTLDFLNAHSKKLEEHGFLIKQVFFERNYYTAGIQLKITVTDESDWFDIRGNVLLQGFSIPFIKFRKNILRDIREYELPDGSIVILPAEWFVKYKEYFLFGVQHADGLHMNKMHFGLINSTSTGINNSYANKLKTLFDDSDQTQTQLPEGLNATLRPYQVEGFTWMDRLKQNQFGGCLADDMGLGKTLQTLTLLLNNHAEKVAIPLSDQQKKQVQLSLFDEPQAVEPGTMTPTSLIVMPASLIYNWYNEIQKFTPILKAYKHTGNNRTKNISELMQYDIVLTTYGVIRNDYELLKSFTFHYVILDESQVIKNPDSKIYQSIIQLNASNRLVLTGTPIENSLTDLWSQINFVNRGLLGNFTFFKREFVTPIEKFNSEHKSERLKALIKPFILRRTKEQVATDLPPRIEQFSICEMTDEQRRIYEEEKSAVRNSILKNMEHHGAEKSSLMVLQALTRLRQLANHPKLINIEEESGKFEEVTRMLMNVISEGHKVLIFSSFVQHLEIYQKFLDENQLTYSLLTGKTQNRQEVIEAFQNNEKNQVFLISLKAGGVGLNLTAADYVFLLDPWWNPASENQAINRAHRIGQVKNVFIYRFISANSIEEKIVQLQEKKSELAELFINSNNPFKEMSPERIKELFD